VRAARGIADSCQAAVPPPPARRPADPARAFDQITRAVRWMFALSRILSGEDTLSPPRPRPLAAATSPEPRKQPAETPAAGTPAAESPTTEATKPASRRPQNGADRWMRHVFATRPIGAIVTRLCRQLGVLPASDLWPDDVTSLTETPAQWSARLKARRSRPRFARPAHIDPPAEANPLRFQREQPP